MVAPRQFAPHYMTKSGANVEASTLRAGLSMISRSLSREDNPRTEVLEKSGVVQNASFSSRAFSGAERSLGVDMSAL